MSRPTVILNWSNSGNFPPGANPWNGQPLALLPVGTFFTPNTKPAAEDLNYLIGTAAADELATMQWAGNDAALNWTMLNTPGSTDYYSSGAYWAENAWYLGVTTPGPQQSQVWASYDGGGPGGWTTMSYPTATGIPRYVQAMIGDPLGALVVSEYDPAIPASRFGIYVGPALGGGSWTQTSFIYSQYFGAVKFFVHYIFGGVDAGGGNLSYARMNIDGTSITHFAIADAASVYTRSAIAASPTIVVIVPSLCSNSTPHFATSFDGLTWTLHGAHAAFGLDVNHWLSGFAYDAVDNLFVATVVTISGAVPGNGTNPTKIYTSTDGINWNLTNTLTSTVVTGLACCGSLWVAPTQQDYSIYSIDLGVTWHRIQNLRWNADSTSPALTAYTPRTIVTNGNQFLAFNGHGSTGSMITGVTEAIA